jgi:galactokinase
MLTAAHEGQPGDAEQHAAVTAALRAGALGGRSLTEGPGRPVLLLVPVDRIAAVRAGVTAEFACAGARAPRFLTFTPAGAPEQPAPL